MPGRDPWAIAPWLALPLLVLAPVLCVGCAARTAVAPAALAGDGPDVLFADSGGFDPPDSEELWRVNDRALFHVTLPEGGELREWRTGAAGDG